MKKKLQQHRVAIDKLLKDIKATQQQAQQATLMEKAWEEIRSCVKTLNAAKLAQRHLSGLYIQLRIARWVREARRKIQEQKENETSEDEAE